MGSQISPTTNAVGTTYAIADGDYNNTNYQNNGVLINTGHFQNTGALGILMNDGASAIINNLSKGIFENVNGATLNNDSIINNSGILSNTNFSTLTNKSILNNSGVLNNNTNGASIVNNGEINSEGEVNNDTKVINNGQIKNNLGANFNSCSLDNNSYFANSGTFSQAPGFTLKNLGTIDNFGLLINNGLLSNQEGAKFNNTGTVDINAVSQWSSDSGANLGIFNNNEYGKINIASKGIYYNHGTINNNAASTLSIAGELWNFTDGKTSNSGQLIILEDGNFWNIGSSVINNGSIQSSGKFVSTGKGTLTNNGKLVNNGFYDISQNASLINNGNLINDTNGVINNDGLIDTTNGTFHNKMGAVLQGTGSTKGNIDNNGTITGGNSSGGYLVDGDLLHNEDGNKFFELAGSDDADRDRINTEYDFVDITGDLILNGGNLEVTLIDGFQLDLDQEFIIAKVDGQLTGTFDGLEEGAIVGSFDSVYGDMDLYLFVTYEAGDGNDIALYTADHLFQLSYT